MKILQKKLLEEGMSLLKTLTKILGIMEREKDCDDLDEEILNLIKEREDARKNKDFKRADEIRDELLEKGIEIKDTRKGIEWKRL